MAGKYEWSRPIWRDAGALIALLTLLLGGACTKPNNTKGGAGATDKGDGGGTITTDTEEVPDPIGSYVPSVDNLADLGTATLDSVGTTSELQTEATVAEARGVIESALKASDVGDRYLAVDGLINAPWPVAEPLLEQALADTEPQVVLLALQQISAQADPATQDLLKQYLDWDDLWRPSEKHPAAYRPRQGFTGDATPIEALARLQDPAVEPKIREKLTVPEDIVANIQGIRLAERYGTKLFQEEIATLFNGNPETTTAYHAARALFLAGINKEGAERFLLKGMTPERLVPSVVVTGMAKELDRKDWEPELRSLLKSPDPTVRGQALEALALMRLPVSDAEIAAILSDLDARSRILGKLNEWEDPAPLIPILEQLVKPEDQDYFIVQLALAKIGSEKAYADLLNRIKNRDANGAWTREAITALSALTELDKPEVVQVLCDILNDPAAPPVRAQFACLQGLGRLQDPASLPTLVRYYRNYASAQPGLAAFAASIAITLASPTIGPSQPRTDRLIWPMPELGRFIHLYPSKVAAAEKRAQQPGGAE